MCSGIILKNLQLKILKGNGLNRYIYDFRDIVVIHKYLMKNCIKKAFNELLSCNGPLVTKCKSLNNEICLAKPALINFILNELHYYSFVVSLEIYNTKLQYS